MTGAAAGFAIASPSAITGTAAASNTARLSAAGVQRLDVRKSIHLPVVAFLMRFTFGPHTFYVGPRFLRVQPKPLKSLCFGPVVPRSKRTTAGSGQTTDSAPKRSFCKI